MAREPGTPGCAAESVGRAEALIATASRVRRWLLVEQPGPWGAEALLESRLDHAIARTLRSHARRSAARVVLIRRPGWQATGERRVYLVRSDRAHRWIEQLDVADPHELVTMDLGALDSDDPPGIGVPGPPAVHLVCTNGRHDPCCADLGRPVVRALREADVPEVWESSHIGGDRFAANVVCLPSGTYFGRVPPDGAARIVREHADGRVDLDHYRGRSCFPPLVQAAEAVVRQHLDEPRLSALRLVAARRDGDDELTAVFEHTDGDRFEVAVGREPGDSAPLTCTGGTGVPWRYVGRGVERLGGIGR